MLPSALRRLDEGDSFPSLEAIRVEVGLTQEKLHTALDALESASPPYLRVTRYAIGGHVDGVSERARRELGTWPTSARIIDELVTAFTLAAEAETEPEPKGRFSAWPTVYAASPERWRWGSCRRS